MIWINRKEVEVNHYPDKTQLLKIDLNKINFYEKSFTIRWRYENDEECMTLWYIVNHIRAHKNINFPINLSLMYIPNARMDRVKKDDEVFTLKYFAQFINSMNFNCVYVFDPHSYVSEALFDRIYKKNLSFDYIWRWFEKKDNIDLENVMLYFPDDGAYKRYKDIFTGDNILYGKKNQDWDTGKILGLTVHDKNGNEVPNYSIENKTILMIDDIISYGGTLAYSADKLHELGAAHIYAYGTHTENSVLDEEKGTLIKRLENGIVDRLFTTDSLYTGNHPKITVIA